MLQLCAYFENSLKKGMKKIYSVEPIKKGEPAFRKTLTQFYPKWTGLMGV